MLGDPTARSDTLSHHFFISFSGAYVTGDQMEKSKHFKRTVFSAEVLKKSVDVFDNIVETTGESDDRPEVDDLSVYFADHSWEYDTLEEFIAGYREGTGVYFKRIRWVGATDNRSYFSLQLRRYNRDLQTTVSVSAPHRHQIESVFEVFEESAIDAQLPEPAQEEQDKIDPTIFIGHGSGQAWRDLKDHLHEQHSYTVQAYETGARAGHAIRDILQEMMSKSAFALLVLTCDDNVGDGKYRARQNVVHETGLFQGRLGFSRAIVLSEDGVEEFSNIAGIHQIRFSKGKIRECFGDVIATIRREFET